MAKVQARVLLVSDSTGETVTASAEAVSSQFPGMEVDIILHPFVRNIERAKTVLHNVEQFDLVLYTVMNPQIGSYIKETCQIVGVPAVPLLDPVVRAFEKLNGNRATGKPGRQYSVDKTYLERVRAIDYAISLDDGLSADHLENADVILVGVSRTSKTPTCIYLAYQGVRAANVPLVPDRNPPDSFFGAMEKGVPVIGLIASPTRLSQVRKYRLKSLGNPDIEDYAEPVEIQAELASARLFFEKHRIPVIDVTRRSIEETAAAIRGILAQKGEK